MKITFWQIVGYNLVASLVLVGVPQLILPKEMQLGVSKTITQLLGIQLALNMSRALSNVEPSAKRAHWLSCLLILLIGLGNCAAVIFY